MEFDRDVQALLDPLADDAWSWFVANTHPDTGLTLDRAPNFPKDAAARRTAASLGGTGFYLSLLPVAVERAKLDERAAARRAETTLRFTLESVDHVDGLLAHFVHWQTGKRHGRSEYSTLDTALFLNGAIVSAQRFGGPCAALCDQLLDRVRWHRLVVPHPHTRKPLLAYHIDGVTHRVGAACADVRSTENLMPCLIACGSRTHPVDASCWRNMAIVQELKLPLPAWVPSPDAAETLNARHGLFTSYYGLAWANLAGLHDPDGVDLWDNARRAALLNRDACRVLWAKRFATYTTENGGWWGISAGDSPAGYVAPNPIDGDRDGTVWPSAALGSFPWIPREFSADLRAWQRSPWWRRARGQYGVGPFSIDRNWVGQDLISIDIGSFAVNWWNARAGLIHRLWQAHLTAKRGLDVLEFSRA